MITKTIRLPEDLSARIGYRAKKEDVDESDAIRQLIKLGLKEYAVNLYRDRKVTLREASELADVSLREMLDLLMEHGIKGNVTMKQQQRSLAVQWILWVKLFIRVSRKSNIIMNIIDEEKFISRAELERELEFISDSGTITNRR